MKKRSMAALLLACAAIGLFLGGRLNRIELSGPIGACRGAGGELYVLAERQGGTSLLCVSPGGVLRKEAPLDTHSGGAEIVYKGLAADGYGNLYVLSETVKRLDGGEGLVLSEAVKMYDVRFTWLRDVFSVSHPGGAEAAAIRKLEAAGDTVYALCLGGGRVEVLAAAAQEGGAPYRLTAFALPAEAQVTDLAAAPDGTVLFTTQAGGLYLARAGVVDDVSAALGKRTVPADFRLDADGNILFLERLSGKVYQWNGEGAAEADGGETPELPGTLWGALFPSLLLRVLLCACACALVLFGARFLVGLRPPLRLRLMLQLFALCAVGGLLLTAGLVRLGAASARTSLERELTKAAAEAASGLEQFGVGNMDLLTQRGTGRAASLAEYFSAAEERIGEDTGLACDLTLYDSRHQRWFTVLAGGEQAAYVPVEEKPLSDACSAAAGGGPLFWQEQRADAVCVLQGVPTAENAAVLELRVSWAETVGAARQEGLVQCGLRVFIFAALVWCCGALALWFELRAVGTSAAEVGQASAEEKSGRGMPTVSSRELLSLLEGPADQPQVCSLCTLYAVFQQAEGPNSFQRLQVRMERLTAITRKNGGYVASAGNGTLLALFDGTAWAACRAAVEFREAFRAEGTEKELCAVVDAGPTTLGVSAGGVLAVSEGIARGARLVGTMAETGVGCLITDVALASLEEGRTICTRFVGATPAGRGEPVGLYEVLDGQTYHRRRLLLATREQFEAGVAAYGAGDPARARGCFAAVAGRDRGDRAALAYLARCGCGEECGRLCGAIF